MKKNLAEIELRGLPLKMQLVLLYMYADYVNSYPDIHKNGGYPASLLEWYDNDYKESTQ